MSIFYRMLCGGSGPFIASLIAGLFGKVIGRKGAHRITILGVGHQFFHIPFDGQTNDVGSQYP